MANRIKIRHGSGTPNKDQLLPYELGWNGTSLYINNGGTVEKVGKEYLPLTGGTLTGNLTISKSDPILYVQNTSMDTSTATNSAITYNQIYFTDKSSRLNGFLQGVVRTDGTTDFNIGVRRMNTNNSSWVQQYFNIGIKADGTASTYFTHPAAWRAGLSVPAMTTESYPALLPTNGTNNWIKIGTANTSYGLLPSQAGGAGSGHNYIGTSSWYWKYAYIDEIHGALNGNAATATKANGLVDGSSTMTSAYNKAGLNYGNYTWLAGWNGYELRAVNKNQFAVNLGTIGSSSTTHATALKAWFNSNKANTPRNQLLSFYDQTGGNGSIDFGYFLTDYDTNPYGGFFSAHYNNPYYIGISAGTYTQWGLIRDSGSTSRRIFLTTSASVPSGAVAGDIVLVKV